MTVSFENFTATTAAENWPGGTAQLHAVATTWNGATVTVQVQGPNDTWISVTDAAFTEDTVKAISLTNGDIRMEVSGATPTGVYVEFKQIGNN